MAVNTSRNMQAELEAGVVDGRYMQLAPNWNTQSMAPQDERMDWPTYSRVDRRQISAGWLVDTIDRRAVSAHHGRYTTDHYNNPTSGVTRETQVYPDKYKFSRDQNGAR